MPHVHLPSDHYAANWTADQMNSHDEVTDLGLRYFAVPEGPEKEALLLELLRSFHGYTAKYLHMIQRGHVPVYSGELNEDTRIFLQRFLPPGTTDNRAALLRACRTLHLAFKGNGAGEVYDILVMCLLKAIQKWDPHYTQKVQKLVDIINRKFLKRKQFTAAELSHELGFNGTGIIRMLARRNFLQSAKDKKTYTIAATWPPPASWSAAPVGLAYFVSAWFRYYLQQYITAQMSQLEAGDVMQLDHRAYMSCEPDGGPKNFRELNMPSATGELVDKNGGRWLADIGLMECPMDLASVNLNWVESTKDPLFGSLSRQERYLLYLIYARELGWGETAAALDSTIKNVKSLFSTVLDKIKAQAQACE